MTKILTFFTLFFAAVSISVSAFGGSHSLEANILDANKTNAKSESRVNPDISQNSFTATKTPAARKVDIYLPQTVRLGRGMEEYSEGKLESGMQLAISLSSSAVLYPKVMLDSVISRYQDKDTIPDAFELAKEIGAHHLLFANVSRIENMLRVNLVAISTDSLKPGYTLTQALATANRGEGYAYVNLWQNNGDPMLDPAIVTATQRAFAQLLKSPTLYDDLKEPYQVYPWPNLALGGFKILDEDKYPIKSDLFKDKIVTAYAASESVFDRMTEKGEYVVWDMATRDTLMQLEGYYGVENYNLASKKELNTLWKAGVSNVILGTLHRQPKGAKITLILGKLTNQGKFEKVEEVTHEFEGELLEQLITETKATVDKLLSKLPE